MNFEYRAMPDASRGREDRPHKLSNPLPFAQRRAFARMTMGPDVVTTIVRPSRKRKQTLDTYRARAWALRARAQADRQGR